MSFAIGSALVAHGRQGLRNILTVLLEDSLMLMAPSPLACSAAHEHPLAAGCQQARIKRASCMPSTQMSQDI